jgi:hypothetical protein
VLENIIRDQGFVDTGILVGLEMDECFFGHAFMRGFLFISQIVSRYPSVYI